MKKRPSNILIYVLISLLVLFGLYFLGLLLESINWNQSEQSQQSTPLAVMPLNSWANGN